MGRDTFQLFASLPSVSEGLARVLDVRGNLMDRGYILSSTPEQADERALASDWSAVMHDLNTSAETIGITSEADAATAVAR